MGENIFRENLAEFVRKPDQANAMALINSCRGFVIRQASCWKAPDLTHFEKIREIMTEMFLILIEDFNPSLGMSEASILSYLNLKLRRLTRPKRSKAIAFGLCDDLSDLGRMNFSSSKLALTEEIVGIIRCALASEEENQCGILEFLFIHVFPEVAWISRAIAERTGEDPEKRHESDRKRHQRFNRNLRAAFNNLESGDWREITTWSSGERSHLAWRIIDISIAETGEDKQKELEVISKWREEFDKKVQHDPQNFASATHIFRALKNHWQNRFNNKYAAVHEAAAAYGDEIDFLESLVRRIQLPEVLRETSTGYQTSVKTGQQFNSDELTHSADFDLAAKEISEWLSRILKD
ncbi:MAG: hypothetical protein Kow0029_00650 [Candidatus Rifleibacteriota bacterium]